MRIKSCLLVLFLLIKSSLLFSQVAINADGSNPNNSAMLDVKSNNKGFLPPRMTHAEMNAIQNPAEGLIIYCTDCRTDGKGVLATFFDGNWNALNVNCYPPMVPIIQTQIPSSAGIVWDWKGVPYATGYKWNILNDYSTATQLDTVTTKTETGLACNTAYTRYVWAYNACGISMPLTLAQTTLACFLPILTTTVASSIASTTATSGGNITSDGGFAITARGVCWSTSQDPTTANSKTNDGTGSGIFTSLITGLVPGTTYYLRTYATNANGTSYGTQTSFTTLSDLATLWPGIAGSLSNSSLSISYEVLTDGGSAVTAHGVCYGLAANPDLLGQKTVAGTGTGSFTSIVTGLNAITTYHFRIYATNSTGTAYSPDQLLTTWPNKPTVKSNGILSDTPYTAIGGGEVTDNGGDNISQRGICYSTSTDPTIADSKTSDGTGNGVFVSSLSGLLPNTLYYAKAYAISWPSVIGYGDQVSFTTKSDIPALTTTAISNTKSTTATSGGDITYDGGTVITVRGVCWSIAANPTVANTRTFDGTGDGVFSSDITLLNPGTTYYVRAYATNTAGKTGYGNQVTIQTNGYPALTTTAITNISNDHASGGGNIFDDGGATITLRGVCWSTKENPTFNDSRTEDGPGKGAYSSSITPLMMGTQYFVRAYAVNATGTSYGNQVSFTTLAGVPGAATDGDGNIYQELVIGTQTWLVGNLKTTKYRNGNPIENITLPGDWKNASSGAYCWYNNDITRKDKMGALYNFYAVTDPRNIAPDGYHVATEADWATLRAFLGNDLKDGYKLMASGPNDWLPSHGTNTTMFTAYPAGYRYFSDGGFYDSDTNENAGIQSYFWTTDVFDIVKKQAFGWVLFDGQINSGGYDYTYGFSVRCVKN
ncbi:MAG: fibrobacter succinogenes major paralogous domain-containing protein [Mariniphaga sp.]